LRFLRKNQRARVMAAMRRMAPMAMPAIAPPERADEEEEALGGWVVGEGDEVLVEEGKSVLVGDELEDGVGVGEGVDYDC
jgi:hypothetical protein